MTGFAFYAFLQAEEFEQWLKMVDSHASLRFWREIGELNSDSPSLDMRAMAKCLSDPWLNVGRYLVSEGQDEPKRRRIDMRDGSGWKLVRSPPLNESFVVFLPGSDRLNGVLSSSMVSCSSSSRAAMNLFRRWKSETKKLCSYVQGFYVSPSAADAHSRGLRLQTHSGEIVKLGESQ